MFVPVLIMQTGGNRDACLGELSKAGFEDGKDFLLFDQAKDLSTYIDPTADQMLVTGLIYFPVSEETFVQEWKSKHSKLKTAFFSVTDRFHAGFDIKIEKKHGADCKHLIEEMKKFLNR